MKTDKVFVTILVLLMICFGYSGSSALEVEIPSSFNPLGSGARAIGRGGAFIAVADDATAASWNPGGLTQLKKPEASVVLSGFHRKEDIEFGTNPEADGLHSVSETNINYLSATYPFELFNRNMVVSLSYQHLYDFSRDWQQVALTEDSALQIQGDQFFEKDLSFFKETLFDYKQEGKLTAIGLSYCVRIIPQLSVGLTLNIWKDGLTDNHWKQSYHENSSGIAGEAFNYQIERIDDYSFKGFNINLGTLWRINYKWTVGAVIKTPFKADIEHKISRSDAEISEIRNEELKMPMSYGIGVAYNFSDNFSVSGDIYRTEWGNFIYRDKDGNEYSPVINPLSDNKNISKSDVKPTHQIRIGSEYLFIDKEKKYIIPVRCGLFYDPAPAQGNPDDYYGFSLGIGFTENDLFSLDISYQYRFANNVGASMLQDLGLSQDVSEHTVYMSMILYSF